MNNCNNTSGERDMRERYHNAQACQQSVKPFHDPVASAEAVLKADAEHRSLAADQILMMRMVMPSVKAQWKQLSLGLFRWFKHQGFWPEVDLRVGPFGEPEGLTVTIPMAEYRQLKKMEKLGLIVTEVAEAMEAVRKGDVDGSQGELKEMADVQVRVLDYIGGFHQHEYLNAPDALGEAFEQKMTINYSRPFKHGKAF
jgi:hypothetical protein